MNLKRKLKWDIIAKQHLDIYENILHMSKDKENIKSIDIYNQFKR